MVDFIPDSRFIPDNETIRPIAAAAAATTTTTTTTTRAGFKGGQGARVPGTPVPTNRGPPPNPSYFFWFSGQLVAYIRLYIIDVTTYFFPYFNAGCSLLPL